MLSIKKNFLFLHIPKTAGNSIQKHLEKYSEDKIAITDKHQDGIQRFNVVNEKFGLSKHATLSQYKKVLEKDVYDSLFKFSVIRNPWERLISFYFSPHRGKVDWNKKQFVQFIEKVPSICHYICEKGLTENFFNRLCIDIYPPKRIIDKDIDFLIRFEDLEEDFKTVSQILNIQFKSLAKLNYSLQRTHYSNYYDDELIKLVDRKFAAEIAFGGYSFDQPN